MSYLSASMRGPAAQCSTSFPPGLKPGEVSMGTSIMAVSFKGGVILGADSRTSTGSYIANRVTDKITPLADNVYILRSGSAADTQAIASYVQMYIALHQAEANERIRVKIAANMAMQLSYSNKDMLQAGLIIAGWDEDQGASVWAIPLGGTLMNVPYAIGGSDDEIIIMDDFHFSIKWTAVLLLTAVGFPFHTMLKRAAITLLGPDCPRGASCPLKDA
ncbi:proteasome core particle subunit beta 1 [Dunaliella salina]|uniref:Proteasome subunit beta n=1 Tax=Dunaliella salina TaxID=3046 RepID=A0ABQ7H9D4_DUNSA|nr:proteasome core particle subunit beta 1 [Dunaliella salina]|eukprot:KAF5843464.1 proteasome core particle subunit beta 1 [Dunaliella salina]